ncbi:MAG: molybdenum cofactor guanylyltransferase [Bacteroidetes bacterium]|jgi:molybdopterin-guanine dinucleotide biosynthesis protein A|nr:molybdenum cofactor guanylyltransferase [Bacteroidota bacterium]
MHNDTIGVILSGGKSSRMGSDKSLLKWNNLAFYEVIGKKLLTLLPEVYISCRKEQKLHFGSYPLIIDQYAEIGPLSGILSSIHQFPEKSILFISCDMPGIDQQLIHKMLNVNTKSNSGVFIYDQAGRLEPMLCLLNPSTYASFENGLLNKIYSIKEIILQLPYQVKLSSDTVLANINNPDEYQHFLKNN